MEKIRKKGIDISYVQKGFDINKAKENGVEFVIIRAGISTRTDTELETHIGGAERVGLPYGFYWYSSAFSVYEAKEEAQACIEAISKYSPVYPVFYDMEEKDQIEDLTSPERTQIICAFCEELKAAGYTAGVYLNPSWLENYVEKDKILGSYELWLAHWTENPDRPTKYDYGQVMWQWGADRIGGETVDGDICYKDYGRTDSDEDKPNPDEDKPDPDTKPLPQPKPDEGKMLPIGASVNFSGGRQYGASNSDIGYPAKAGVVKISIRADGTLHPYHVISEDGSGVYGWVDADTLSPRSGGNDVDRYRAGEKILLKNAELYGAAEKSAASRKISGSFYLYDGKNVNGFYRICPSENNVNAVPVAKNVTGWVEKSSIGF